MTGGHVGWLLFGLRAKTNLTVSARVPRADAVLRVHTWAPIVRTVALLELFRWFLGVVGGRAGETAKLGKLELEIDIVQIVEEEASEMMSDALLNGPVTREYRQPLLILVQLVGQLFNLGTESFVLMVRGLGQFLQFLDFIL